MQHFFQCSTVHVIASFPAVRWFVLPSFGQPFVQTTLVMCLTSCGLSSFSASSLTCPGMQILLITISYNIFATPEVLPKKWGPYFCQRLRTFDLAWFLRSVLSLPFATGSILFVGSASHLQQHLISFTVAASHNSRRFYCFRIFSAYSCACSVDTVLPVRFASEFRWLPLFALDTSLPMHHPLCAVLLILLYGYECTRFALPVSF